MEIDLIFTKQRIYKALDSIKEYAKEKRNNLRYECIYQDEIIKGVPEGDSIWIDIPFRRNINTDINRFLKTNYDREYEVGEPRNNNLCISWSNLYKDDRFWKKYWVPFIYFSPDKEILNEDFYSSVLNGEEPILEFKPPQEFVRICTDITQILQNTSLIEK